MATTGVIRIISPYGRSFIVGGIDVNKILENFHVMNFREFPALYNSLIVYGTSMHELEVLEFCKPHELDKQVEFYKSIYETQFLSIEEDGWGNSL